MTVTRAFTKLDDDRNPIAVKPAHSASDIAIVSAMKRATRLLPWSSRKMRATLPTQAHDKDHGELKE